MPTTPRSIRTLGLCHETVSPQPHTPRLCHETNVTIPPQPHPFVTAIVDGSPREDLYTKECVSHGMVCDVFAFHSRLCKLERDHALELRNLHEEFDRCMGIVGVSTQAPPNSQLFASGDSAATSIPSVAARDMFFNRDLSMTGLPSIASNPGSDSSSPVRIGAVQYRSTGESTQSGHAADTTSRAMKLTAKLRSLNPYKIRDNVQRAIFYHYSKHVLPDEKPTGRLAEFAVVKGWHKISTDLGQGSILERFIRSRRFDVFCAVAIVVNALVLGLATDYAARNQDPDYLPPSFEICDRVFALWFAIELFLRIFCVGFLTWLLSPEWRWNLFDTLVVSIDIVESVLAMLVKAADANALQNLTAIRMLRVFRIARAIRVVRLIRFCKDLRLMVISILNSAASLFWCCAMLAIIIYMFAIFLMQNVVYHTVSNRHAISAEDYQVLRDKFGTVTDACFVLYQSISGGISWHELADPLIAAHWSNGLMFCFYIFFTLFSMLNIITGIFVETAMNSAQNDHEEVIAEQMHNEKSTLSKLKHLFEEVNSKRTGELSSDEFEKSLKDPRIRAKLHTIGIEVQEARGIFKLLDLDGSGTISIQEFVYGCMRMKGGAKGLDLTTLLYEQKRMAEKVSGFSSFVKDEFTRLKSVERSLESIMDALSIDRLRSHASTTVASAWNPCYSDIRGAQVSRGSSKIPSSQSRTQELSRIPSLQSRNQELLSTSALTK